MQRWLLKTVKRTATTTTTTTTTTTPNRRSIPGWNSRRCRRLATTTTAANQSYSSSRQPLSSALDTTRIIGYPNPLSLKTGRIRHFSVSGTNQTNFSSEDPLAVGVAAVDTNELSDGDDDDDNDDGDEEVLDDSDDDDDDEEMEEDPFLDSSMGDETRLIFREHLNNWYRANFDVSLSDAFVTSPAPPSEEDDDDDDDDDEPLPQSQQPPQQRWTSTFICPVTKHEIKAWNLPRAPKARGSFDTKKLANQAAAFQAIQFFCPWDALTEEEASNNGAQLARKRLQLHYMKKHKIVLTDGVFDTRKINRSGKKHGGTWWTASFRCPVTGERFQAMKLEIHENTALEDGQTWYRRKGDAIQAACEHGLWATETGTAGIAKDVFDIYSIDLSTAPLRQWYRKHHHDLDLTNENFVVTTGSWKGSGGNLWTATFICPATGDRYDSGEIKRLTPVSNEGGIQWYKKKSDAVVAAALRAYDALVYHATGKNHPRFCREDPSGKDATVYGSQEIAEATNHDDGEHEELYMPQINLENSTDDEKEHETDVDNDEGDGAVGEDDDDDYTIEFVPQRIGESFEGATASSTLDLVVETWIHSNQAGYNVPSKLSAHPLLTTKASKMMRTEAIQRAHAWVSQQQETAPSIESESIRFDRIGTPGSRTLARMLLQSLARANRVVPEEKEPSGVEEAAKSIIDYLLSSPSTSPDADCFALYIQCLEGGYHTVTKKAARIFNAMATGTQVDGHVMPPPDTSTFNSLVQRKAEFGILTNLSELEGVEVNKETFLSCLSAVAHATGQGGFGFDSQYVLDCIQEMKVRSFQPDIEIYNAPMRWSGNLGDALISRPYTRPIAWHGLIFESNENFQNSFNEQDPRVKEAQAIENWFRSIDAQAFGSSVRPNIETFESVIQAWIRTHTSRGLDHAEEILDLLHSRQGDELKIRSQTIHPFIAASAYAGDFERVDRWCQKLSKGDGQTLYDGRLRAAPILARLVDKNGSNSKGGECLLLLKEAVEEAKQDSGTIVDARAFAMVVEALYNQGIESRSSGNIPLDCLSDIQTTLELFDEFLASLLGSSDNDRRIQRLHLMHFAPMVYSSTFFALQDLQSGDEPRIPHYLPWLEGILRRTGEHCVLSEKLEEPLPHVGLVDGLPVYADGFSYNIENVLRRGDQISWKLYYNSVINSISEMYPRQEERSNELLRLLVLGSSLLQRDRNSSQGTAANFTKYLDEVHIEHTNPLVAQMRREFGHSLSYQFIGGGKKDSSFLRKSGPPNEVARLQHENRRRKRKEKQARKPTQRPRKSSTGKGRVSQSSSF